MHGFEWEFWKVTSSSTPNYIYALYHVRLHTLNKTHAKTSQCVGRLRRLEATGVQRRKGYKVILLWAYSRT